MYPGFLQRLFKRRNRKTLLSGSRLFLSRYPEDGYVDILGMDNYDDLSAKDGAGIALANQKLKLVSDLAKEKVKIAAMTETGYFVEVQNLCPPIFIRKNYLKY